jgi:hypothetical protein
VERGQDSSFFGIKRIGFVEKMAHTPLLQAYFGLA